MLAKNNIGSVAIPHDGLPPDERRWAMIAIWLAVLMAVLDGSIANVALPTIAGGLHAAASESIWIVNAYQLAIVVSLLPLAALGQIVTFRRVFLSGLVLFVVSSIGCCIAHTLPELAIARAIQGFGAAGIMSNNGALLRFVFPSASLGRGVGQNALVVAIGAAIGPTVASAILSVGSWPWLFAVNVPLGLAAYMVGYRSLPITPRASHSLDMIATVLNVAAFGLIVVGIDALSHGVALWKGGAALATGIIAGWLLVRRSLPQKQPLVPVDLLRDRLFALTVATSVASFTAQMLAFLALPFLLQAGLHRSASEVGLLITPWPVGVGIAAPIAGRLADRYPASILSSIGLTLLAIGLGLLSQLSEATSSPVLIGCMALCGLGFGFFQAPNNRTLLSSAPRERSGAAGGMLAFARLTGQTTGAMLAAILYSLMQNGPVFALKLGCGVAALAAIISVTRMQKRPAALVA